ncbi:MAG: ATP-binding protein [Candidatus Electryonea clarkiae]|nr:ATP-binding protein [Candidatus Electryonea clarkiae]
MSFSPIEHSASLRIGTVEFVAPDELKVLLDLDAPDGVAANAGIPRSFPRINNYVIIPSETGYIVGQIEWIAVERSPFPKRKGFQDYGLVDLPFPLRKMRVNPLGILKVDENDNFLFQRGVQIFPSIGEPVLMPTDKQLRAIVESGERRRVKIGTSPLAANADVSIDPDRLFGRHLAVLGNTGSGKSCSVAGLIQWSLESAKKNGKEPNARFIVLDPNGEYSKVFKKKGRVFVVDNPENPLQIPLWFWNSSEWCSFTQASLKAQRPLLKRALREMRSGKPDPSVTTEDARKLEFRRYLSSNMISIRKDLRSGAIKTNESQFGFRLKAIREDLDVRKATFTTYNIQDICDKINTALTASYNSFTKDGKLVEFYRAFTEVQVNNILDSMNNVIQNLGGIIYQEGPDEDIPVSFSGAEFADHLQILAEQENVSQFLDFLVMRIRTMLADTRMKKIIGDEIDVTLDKWLEDYIGKNKAENGCVTVIDLSLVPTEIMHITVAVIARMIFEALQRYRKLENDSLPTVMVMEEAHTFIKRYKEDAENQNVASICCQVFEKIAREGRKFGLGLVLSSQRPSELSPTVLSQCNSFLLHRISNDRDQELVNKLVPDTFRGLLRELPSLPTQNAILLGWASELPVMVKMNHLPAEKRPHSEDPDFWDVWTGKNNKGEEVLRDVDWKKIADEWQKKDVATNDTEGNADTSATDNR